MLTREFATNFAKDWVDAWNARDLDRVLTHYHHDFEMSSPKIASIAGEPSGVLRGKNKVAAYWAQALAIIPVLNFQLIDVFVGADSLILHYRSHSGAATEVFFFDEDGLVIKAAANYAQ
jgi:ketosteroid isomerase-like protein